MGGNYGKATADGIGRACDFAFMETMLLAIASTLGSAAIFLAFWPRLPYVFALEAAFVIAVTCLARRSLSGLSAQVDDLADGIREFAEGDGSFRFEGTQPGSIEDSMNMWMDVAGHAADVADDVETIGDEAARIELIVDAMLNNVVPRDADMLLATKECAGRIRAIAASREESA